MQTDIDALVVFDVYRYVLDWVQRPSVTGLEILEVGRDNVIGLPSGDPLSKLAPMVRIKFPSRLPVLGTPDLDFDAEDWPIVRPPNSAEDQSVRLVRFQLLLSGGEGSSHGEEGKE